MVRILALRAFIAALKQAIAVSDKLKPSTWKYLAVAHTVLLVFSMLALYRSRGGERPYSEDITPLGSTVQLSSNATDPNGDTLLYTYSTTGGRVLGNGLNAMLDLTGSAPGSYTVTIEVDDRCGCISFTGLALVSRFKPSMPQLASLGEWFGFPRSPRDRPLVVLKFSAPEDASFVSVLQTCALLFSTIFNSAGAISSLILAWIGYSRSKTEQLLREAQLLKIHLEIEQLRAEIARTRGEPQKPEIIIVSG